MSRKRSVRRKLFAALAVVAGLVLLAFEFGGERAASGTQVERWFWALVALGLIGLGVAELLAPTGEQG